MESQKTPEMGRKLQNRHPNERQQQHPIYPSFLTTTTRNICDTLLNAQLKHQQLYEEEVQQQQQP